MGRTCAHTGRSYRWTPRTQRSFLWPSQGSFACKETFRRKALSGIGKPRGVPIRLIHCCARRKGGRSLNTKGPLGRLLKNLEIGALAVFLPRVLGRSGCCEQTLTYAVSSLGMRIRL